jgi:hypothetical protein
MTTVDRAIANALTAQVQAQPAPGARPETVIVEVPKESRLEQLLCLEEKRRAKYETAKAEWDEWKKGVTAELEHLYTGNAAPTKGFEIPGGPMWKAIAVSWRDGKEYLPTDLIKQHIPQVWDAFKKRGSGYWDVRRMGKRS